MIFIISKLRYLLLPTIMLSVVSCNADNGKVEREIEGSESIENAFDWFLEEGLSNKLSQPGYQLKENISLFGVSMGADLGLGEAPYKVLLFLHSSFMGGTLVCYERKEEQGIIYEYWVKKIGSRRGDVGRKLEFIITKSEGFDRKRVVVTRSHSFIDNYMMPSGDVLAFPENIRSIEILMPWEDEVFYEGTFLEKYKRKNINGKYKVVIE